MENYETKETDSQATNYCDIESTQQIIGRKIIMRDKSVSLAKGIAISLVVMAHSVCIDFIITVKFDVKETLFARFAR